jgi:hypothetical protein
MAMFKLRDEWTQIKLKTFVYNNLLESLNPPARFWFFHYGAEILFADADP